MLQFSDGVPLQFRDAVQLIKLQTDDPVSGDRTDQPSPGKTVTPVLPKSGGDNGHKHSSDGGSEFLAVPIVAIVFTFLYLIAKTVMAPFNNRNRHTPPMSAGGGGLTQEEVAVLQKIQRTLSQMESRVEALETILIEQARSEKKYGSKL